LRPRFPLPLSIGFLLAAGVLAPVSHSVTPAPVKKPVPKAKAAPSPPDLSARAASVLRKNCTTCHGDVKQGGLDLRNMSALLKGGGRGPALVPGDAAKSLLYRVVAHQAEPHMPPGGKLPPGDIAAIKAWIDGGGSKLKAAPDKSARAALPDFRAPPPPKPLPPPQV
jgi:mono/diheme cytochrome c family protein